MTKNQKTAGLALAMAAATLFAAVPSSSFAAKDSNVHCYGVNKCKGHNDCKTANNECKGHGSCKGKGFVAVSKEACEKLGGKVGK